MYRKNLMIFIKSLYLGMEANACGSLHTKIKAIGNISTRGGSSLKLIDKFTYLRSSVSSTEKDIDTWLTKA